MACKRLKQKIHDILSDGYFNAEKDYVDVSDGDDDLVHIIVVSRKFNGYTMKSRGNIIWHELFDHLSTEEWGNVTLSIGMMPEEVRFCY